MNEDKTRQAVVANLLIKADQALAAAARDFDAGDLGLATNRIYYACFYALSAVLLREKRQFSKHSGVRAALHKNLVRTGRLGKTFGQFYDRAFAERQEADYNAMAEFDAAILKTRIKEAQAFVTEMKQLLTNG